MKTLIMMMGTVGMAMGVPAVAQMTNDSMAQGSMSSTETHKTSTTHGTTTKPMAHHRRHRTMHHRHVTAKKTTTTTTTTSPNQ